MPHLLANFGTLFGVDGIVVFVVGMLIFGRRLPEVGRNLAKSFNGFAVDTGINTLPWRKIFLILWAVLLTCAVIYLMIRPRIY
jgi:branched-subunit amino acid ABC-type transport system permease component